MWNFFTFSNKRKQQVFESGWFDIIDFVLGEPLYPSWCESQIQKKQQAYEKLIHDVIQGVSWMFQKAVCLATKVQIYRSSWAAWLLWGWGCFNRILKVLSVSETLGPWFGWLKTLQQVTSGFHPDVLNDCWIASTPVISLCGRVALKIWERQRL